MTVVKPSIGTIRPAVSAQRERLIQASPQAIFALLSEPSNLSAVLPRVSRVEVLGRGAVSARVRTHMAIGPLGSMASEGEVRWVADREFSFCSERPVAIESRWTLTPEGSGTRISVVMTLDLTPMIGPLAAFVPVDSVTAMVGPDLEAALAAIARRVEGR